VRLSVSDAVKYREATDSLQHVKAVICNPSLSEKERNRLMQPGTDLSNEFAESMSVLNSYLDSSKFPAEICGECDLSIFYSALHGEYKSLKEIEGAFEDILDFWRKPLRKVIRAEKFWRVIQRAKFFKKVAEDAPVKAATNSVLKLVGAILILFLLTVFIVASFARAFVNDIPSKDTDTLHSMIQRFAKISTQIANDPKVQKTLRENLRPSGGGS
jgi:hypothetical protein